jgi:sulfite exporter TauE/SafE
MSSNIGLIDRIVRVLAGIVLIAFALGIIAPATGRNWEGWIGVLPFVTGLIGISPAYAMFGLSTRKRAGLRYPEEQ